MTARRPKVVVFKGELTKAAVIFFCFFSLPGRTAPSFLEATAKTTCPPRQVIWRRVAHQTRLGVAGLPPPHAPGVLPASARGLRRLRCSRQAQVPLEDEMQGLRHEHARSRLAGHETVTRGSRLVHALGGQTPQDGKRGARHDHGRRPAPYGETRLTPGTAGQGAQGAGREFRPLSCLH